MARRDIPRVGTAPDQDLALARVEPLHRDLSLIKIVSGADREQDGLAIRKKLRPAVAEFALL